MNKTLEILTMIGTALMYILACIGVMISVIAGLVFVDMGIWQHSTGISSWKFLVVCGLALIALGGVCANAILSRSADRVPNER